MRANRSSSSAPPKGIIWIYPYLLIGDVGLCRTFAFDPASLLTSLVNHGTQASYERLIDRLYSCEDSYRYPLDLRPSVRAFFTYHPRLALKDRPMGGFSQCDCAKLLKRCTTTREVFEVLTAYTYACVPPLRPPIADRPS